MAQGYRDEGGFTLLELIIALSLVALIMLLLFSGMRMAVRAWDAGSSRAEKVLDVALVQGVIRRQLRQAHKLFVDDSSEGRHITFVGDDESVEFVSPMMAYISGGGLFVIRLELEEAQQRRLILSYRPYQAVQEEEAEWKSVVLMEPVKGVEFSYFGGNYAQDDGRWRNVWSKDSQVLPRLVRIQVDGGVTEWPELTVALHQ